MLRFAIPFLMICMNKKIAHFIIYNDSILLTKIEINKIYIFESFLKNFNLIFF